jgi:formamidopyrimidine-DNA glycosylase
MPELPEVETIRRSLLPRVLGARITEVTVRERRMRRPIADDFEERLQDRRIRGIARRGKYLLFDLEPPATLLVHLGMSGALELRDAGLPLRPHDHLRITLDGTTDMVFNDPRRFGLLCVGNDAQFEELNEMAPDPFSQDWSAEHLRARTRHRRLPIKNLLMDQRAVGGIGNIYANEMLYRAGIRPRRRAGSLTRREVEALAAAARAVLDEAVQLGGSSISDFRDGRGRPGLFQLRLAVYQREGEPCSRCASPIKRLVFAGRSSFYCPKCQR